MKVPFLYDDRTLTVRVPDDAVVYASDYPLPGVPEIDLVLGAVHGPAGARPLPEALARRRSGDVVVVVSDVTRPVPYSRILPGLLGLVESSGVRREEILILVATGMHRPTSPAELDRMVGADIANSFRVADHRADAPDAMERVPGESWSGRPILLNRHYVRAGFRLVTGLVEPHFMAGFSGGRKSICPGLAGLETIRRFHGAEFLGDPRACNAVLEGNPCHLEALSVARAAEPDFTANMVLNRDRRIVAAFAGGLEAAHGAACGFVRRHACREVFAEADLAITSSGGYPLDATFYQCVKGFVSCLPAIRRGGTVLAFGRCGEGIGSEEYARTLLSYAGRWRDFGPDIRRPGFFVKDQWEFQMHLRALEKAGEENLVFVSSGLGGDVLGRLSVVGVAAAEGDVEAAVQRQADAALGRAQSVAVFPEGPYCVPVARGGAAGGG